MTRGERRLAPLAPASRPVMLPRSSARRSVMTHRLLLVSLLAAGLLAAPESRGQEPRIRAGAPIELAAPVTTWAAGDQSTPALAEGAEVHLLVWEDERDGGTIRGARVRLSDHEVLDASGLDIGVSPRRTANPAAAGGEDTFMVVWEDERDFSVSRFDIYGIRVSAASGEAVDAEPFALSQATENQAAPAVAYDGAGFLAVFEDRQNVVARQSEDVRDALRS